MTTDNGKSIFRWLVLIILCIITITAVSGCQQDPAVLEATVAARVEETRAAISTATYYPTYTLQATNTAYPTFTPQPTSTRYPTYTALPTNTKNPTYTPLPTNTRLATYTALPTNTLYPTYTPLPTNTSYPTYTPLPTNTKNATYTPLPTQTRYPTSTPFPTNTAYPTYTPAATYTEVVRIVMVTPTTDINILKAPKGDGFYLVGPEIAHGIWRSEGDYNKCYWKVTDVKGGILSNFIGSAGGTVYLDKDAYQIEIRNCGYLKYYSPIY